MYLGAITAVLTAIELQPELDAAVAEILAAPLSFGDEPPPALGIGSSAR